MQNLTPFGTPGLAGTIKPSQGEVVGGEIDVLSLLGTLWRGKWIILLCMLLCLGLGGYYTFKMATPLYPAKAVVALEDQEQQVVDIQSVLSGVSADDSALNTEVEVLRSRLLIEKLVAELNLVADPEFNEALRPVNPWHPVTLVKAQLGVDDPVLSEAQIHNAVIDQTLSQIKISNIRNSLVFSITATTTDAEKSAEIANTLARLYIQSQLDEKFEATETASAWLSERAAELKVALETSEAKVKEFNAGTKLISLEALEAQSRQLKDLRERLEVARSAAVAAQARLDAAQAAGTDPAAQVEALEDRELTEAYARLQDGGSLRAFQTVLVRVQLRAERAALRAAEQAEILAGTEAELAAEIDSQSIDLIELQQLRREAEANRLLYESFLSRLKETAVQKGLQQADSRLLSPAVPRPASSPKKGLLLVLSLLVGTMLGAGLVLLRELRHQAFRTSDELSEFTNLPVLGTIPKIPGRARRDVLKYVQEKPTSVVAEAVRNLRTSILMSNIDNPPQVIMSTSSVPGEGKTTQSLTLAHNMAGLGKKVLVVEGDLRRRVFREYFELPRAQGVVSVVSGSLPLEEAVQPHPEYRFDILVGEETSINAADLYSSERFAKVIEDMRAAYDYIVLDTPPVLVVPDARVIGQHADAIVFTVHWDETTKTQVRQGVNMLQGLGLKISGLVLGQVDYRTMKRYGYGGQYGYDAYGGGYYTD